MGPYDDLITSLLAMGFRRPTPSEGPGIVYEGKIIPVDKFLNIPPPLQPVLSITDESLISFAMIVAAKHGELGTHCMVTLPTGEEFHKDGDLTEEQLNKLEAAGVEIFTVEQNKARARAAAQRIRKH